MIKYFAHTFASLLLLQLAAPVLMEDDVIAVKFEDLPPESEEYVIALGTAATIALKAAAPTLIKFVGDKLGLDKLASKAVSTVLSFFKGSTGQIDIPGYGAVNYDVGKCSLRFGKREIQKRGWLKSAVDSVKKVANQVVDGAKNVVDKITPKSDCSATVRDPKTGLSFTGKGSSQESALKQGFEGLIQKLAQLAAQLQAGQTGK